MNVRFFYDHFTQHRITYIVFLCSLFLYGTLSYKISLYTDVFLKSFDCIFSLDTKRRYNATTNIGMQIDYLSWFHLLYLPVSRSFYFILHLFVESKTAIWLFMILCASGSNTLFYLSLTRLNLPSRLCWQFTVLFGTCFSTLLYAQQYDAPVLLGLFTNAFIYLVISHPKWITQSWGFLVLFTLSVGALLTGIAQIIVFSTIYLLGKAPRNPVLYTRLWLIALLMGTAYIYFLMAAGINSMYFTQHINESNGRQYFFIDKYEQSLSRDQPKIRNTTEHVLWVISNLVSPDVYVDTFRGVFVNPVVGYPISFRFKMNAHHCTWFKYQSGFNNEYLAGFFMLLYFTGIYFALRTNNRCLQALAITSVAYQLFYGFAYLTLTSYLYGSQFLPFYVLICAFGYHQLQERIDTSSKRMENASKILETAVIVVILVAAILNLEEFSRLNAFTSHYFKIR